MGIMKQKSVHVDERDEARINALAERLDVPKGVVLRALVTWSLNLPDVVIAREIERVKGWPEGAVTRHVVGYKESP